LVSSFGQSVVAAAEARGIPVMTLTPEVMATVAEKDNPQGLVAVARPRRARLEDLTPNESPFLAALVNPQDPGNLGAILRTLDAVGGSGLILLDGGVDAYHPSAVRASMGAVFRMPVASAPFAAFATWAAGHGYHVIGTSARGRTDYRSASTYALPLVLLLGSEREGLTTAQADVCETILSLPMRGRVSSLNLAVAAGVFLYAIHDALQARSALQVTPNSS
jgi:TrmH family RNA methyltransferase